MSLFFQILRLNLLFFSLIFLIGLSAFAADCEKPLAVISKADPPYVPQDGNTYDFSKEFASSRRGTGQDSKSAAPSGRALGQGPTTGTSVPYRSSYISPGLFNLISQIPLGKLFELTRDGKYLLHTLPDGKGNFVIRVTDLDLPAQPLGEFAVGEDIIKVITSPDGSRIIFIGDQGEMTVVDSGSWKVISKWYTAPVFARVFAASFNTDRLISADNQSFIIPDPAGSSLHIHELNGTFKHATSSSYPSTNLNPSLPLQGVTWGAAISPDSKILFRIAVGGFNTTTGSNMDAYLIVEDLASSGIIHNQPILLGKSGDVKLIIDPNQKFIVATGMYDIASKTDTTIVLEWGTWRLIKRFSNTTMSGTVHFTKFLNNNMVLAGSFGTIVIETPTLQEKILPNSKAIMYAGFAAQNSLYYTVDFGGEAKFYDTNSWNYLFTLQYVQARQPLDAVHTSSSGDTILTMVSDQEILVTDRASLNPVEKIWSDYHSKRNEISNGSGLVLIAPNQVMERINKVLVSSDNYVITKSGAKRIEIMKFKP